jgi:hypothetical protein
LLSIAQRGRRKRLATCLSECVGHKVMSSRSSSSVQRDIAASVVKAPSATYRASDSRRDFCNHIFST